jgi:hypothetical protein
MRRNYVQSVTHTVPRRASCTSVESLIYAAEPLPANFYFSDHVLGTCRLTRRLAIMKWSMDHVLTSVVWMKKANCYNIAVYCHVVLDEGERRKKGFCIFKTDWEVVEEWILAMRILYSESVRCGCEVDIKFHVNICMAISRWWDGTERVPTFQ